MKRLLISIILLSLISCGQVSVKTYHENGKPSWDISERTFGKNLAGVKAKVGEVEFSMDGSSVEVQMLNMVLASQQALMQQLVKAGFTPVQ